MTKKRWIAATALAAFCFLVLGVLALLPARTRFSEANFRRTEIGMSYKEVEAILGKPSDVLVGANVRICSWGSPEFGAAITFDEDNRVTCNISRPRKDDRTCVEKLLDLLPWRERKYTLKWVI